MLQAQSVPACYTEGLERPFGMDELDRPASGDITGLLREWNGGDELAFEQLVPLVYDELHRLAMRYLAGERKNVTLQPTALVNEVCLRLLGWNEGGWQN